MVRHCQVFGVVAKTKVARRVEQSSVPSARAKLGAKHNSYSRKDTHGENVNEENGN